MNNSERLTIDKISTEGCINLIEMFVTELGEEFRYSYDFYMHNKENKNAREHYKNVRDYIMSDYFSRLTCLDGKAIAAALEADCARKIA